MSPDQPTARSKYRQTYKYVFGNSMQVKKKIVVGFIGLIIMSTYWCYNCPRYGYLQHNIM